MEVNEMSLFQILDESTKILEKELDTAYLEALIHSAENLIDEGKVYNEEGTLSKEVVEKLTVLYKDVELEKFEPETIRKAMQFALLRGMKEDNIQPNHQMTPDSLGNLIAYLIEIIVEPSEMIHLADLTVGTGNLLLTVNHFLNQASNRKILLSGIDNDELLLSIASTNSAIQRTPINLQYQDSLSNLLLNPADIIVSDLPIGYYPITEGLSDYKTAFTEEDEKSYSHYLLIEQSLNYLKDSGFGFFLLPSDLFNDPKISVLLNYLNEAAYIQALIELPKELFANEKSRKTVVVIQKKGADAKQMGDVLLTSAPDFKNFEAMKLFLGEVNEWKKQNK